LRARTAPTRILVARHGETVANREGRFCGHSETELTERGRAQAAALACRLRSTVIHAAYASDFSRAVLTAQAVLAGRSVDLVLDPSLREVNYGDWELERERAVRSRDPEAYRLLAREDPAWRPPRGETLAEVRARTHAALLGIIQRHRARTVLVVSHGTAINCMVAELLGVAPSHTLRFQVSQAAFTEITMSGGRPYLVCLNDRSHLAGLESAP
jgi:broad specificity phosphatase PhoE